MAGIFEDEEEIAAMADEASWGVSRAKNAQLDFLKSQQNAWQSRGQFCITHGGDVIAKQRQANKRGLRASSSVGYKIVRLSKGKLPVVCVGEPEFDANDPIASIRALMTGLRNWYAGLQGSKRKQMEELATQLEGEFLPGETLVSAKIQVSVSMIEETLNDPESQAPAGANPDPAYGARRAELDKLSKASTYKVVSGSLSKPKRKKSDKTDG